MSEERDDLDHPPLAALLRRWGAHESQRADAAQAPIPAPPDLQKRLLEIAREERERSGPSRTAPGKLRVWAIAASLLALLGAIWWIRRDDSSSRTDFVVAQLSLQPDLLRGDVTQFRSGERVFVLCSVRAPANAVLAMLDSAGNFSVVLDERNTAPVRALSTERRAPWSIELDDHPGREAVVILASATLATSEEFSARVREVRAALDARPATDFADALVRIRALIAKPGDVSVHTLVFEHLPR